MSRTTPTPSVPPLVSDSVFTVSASSVINASREHVWRVLTDFKSYHEWNPFVRAQNVVDRATRQPVGDDAMAEGQFLNISHVHIPPTMGKPGFMGKSSAFEKVTSFDCESYRLSWVFWGATPRWMLYAERFQTLIDEGNGQTRYYTVEAFTGVLAYVVKVLYHNGLVKGFQEMADALKERAENSTTPL